MNKKGKSKRGINVTITGDTSGQIAVGKNIKQRQQTGSPITAADIESFEELISELRTKVASEAPEDKKAAALERVQELEQAVTEEKPDLSTMEYVRKWFGKNVPALAGAVTSVVVHPIVGKLVEAGGDLLAQEFQRRFGGTS